MRIFYAISIAVISFCFTSCSLNCVEGSGKAISRSLELATFSEIELNSSITVHLSQGETQTVMVKGAENLIQLLNKEVKGDSWTIEFEECVNSTEDFTVFITVTNLERIELNGSGTITADSTIKGEILELALDGSGDMNLQLQVKELTTDLNGSGDLVLKGSTKMHQIELDGSGDINAEKLKSDNVSIKLDGSGDVRVFASYKLDIKVDGSGDVYYKGDVKSINSQINGSGNLHQINE